MNSQLYSGEPRAEELIAEIYRQLVEQRLLGRIPEKVCLPITYIRRLRIYRALMGGLVRFDLDYLEDNSIFGLVFYIHESKTIVVS